MNRWVPVLKPFVMHAIGAAPNPISGTGVLRLVYNSETELALRIEREGGRGSFAHGVFDTLQTLIQENLVLRVSHQGAACLTLALLPAIAYASTQDGSLGSGSSSKSSGLERSTEMGKGLAGL